MDAMLVFEDIKRSTFKTITWRIIATITTASLVYLLTKEITVTLSIGILEIIIKMAFYFVHERVWNSINLGKVIIPNDVKSRL